MPRTQTCIWASLTAAIFASVCGAQPECPHGWSLVFGLEPATSTVDSLKLLASGDVLMCGTFYSAENVPARGLARWNVSADTWTALGTELSGSSGYRGPRCSLELPSGEYLIGGAFTSVSGTPASGLARMNPSTGAAHAIGTLRATTGVPLVTYLALLPDGDVFVSGYFSEVNGVPAANMARLHPATETLESIASVPFPSLTAISQMPNGGIVAAGRVEVLTGSEAMMARWQPDTNSWETIGSHPFQPFCVDQNHSSPYCYSHVTTLAPRSSGELLIAGLFLSAGGASGQGIIRVNSDGSLPWSRIGAMNGTISGILQRPNDVLVAIGSIWMGLNGTGEQSRVAKWNPTTLAWTSISDGLYTGPSCAIFLPDGDLLVGGTPPSNGGPMLSRFRDVPDPLDFDCNRRVTPHDIFAFLSAWFGADSAADFNHDGHVDTGDIYSYVGEWFSRH